MRFVIIGIAVLALAITGFATGYMLLADNGSAGDIPDNVAARGSIPEIVESGYVCDGSIEWVAYEDGPSPAEVRQRAEAVYTPEKCGELKLLDTCGGDGDYADCPRLTE